jgi:hypothetical protein
MKTRGNGHIAPCILNLSTGWRWVVSFMPWLLYPLEKKSPQYPLDTRLGGTQSWPAQGGKEKNSYPCQKLNPSHPACSRVMILTELPWLPGLIIFKLTAIILETSLPQPSGVKLYTVHFIMLPALEYSILSRSLQNIFEDGMFT